MTPPWISSDSGERKLNAVSPALFCTVSMASVYRRWQKPGKPGTLPTQTIRAEHSVDTSG